jgi:hypothetical protein
MDLAKIPWIYIPEDSNHNTHCQKNADQHQSSFPNFASHIMLRNGKYKQLYENRYITHQRVDLEKLQVCV